VWVYFVIDCGVLVLTRCVPLYNCSYRKTRGWSMASILEEVEMYCESEGDVLDALFIDNFRLTPTVVDPACAAVYGMEGTETRT
jgi:hypothetical protein